MFLGVAAISLIGCSQTVRRGVILMKIDDTEAHVGLGAGEVKIGDELTVYRYHCRKACWKNEVGRGTVIQVLNDSYSIARFRPRINLREGDIVETAPSGK
jgi:hypothetical protein